MKFTVLADDKVRKRGILAEHGLSLLIEYQDRHILFDTGQSDVYLRNASALQLDLNKTDFILLSHGHYDHCGGLSYLPDLKKKPNIYLQKSALKHKYVTNPDGKTHREIGIPWSLEDYARFSDQLVLLEGMTKIASGISLYDNIPLTSPFENAPKGFYIKEGNELSADGMEDEQMLVLDTAKGLVIFLGCSHRGIINSLNYAKKEFPDKKIHTLVAGMHLDLASPQRIEQTIQALQAFDMENLLPVHCTGIYAINEMKRFFGERCQILYAGDTFEL